MNKLIDVDMLCRTLDKQVGSPSGNSKLMEVNRVIVEMPWVDAIPMDWLLDLIHDDDPELSKAAAKIKREWEFEQRMRGKGI